MVSELKSNENSFVVSSVLLALVLTSVFVSVVVTNPAHAETGKGKDVFKVILTVFGADSSKGDIVAIVTVNNGEASKVKFLDTSKLQGSSPDLNTSAPSTINPAAESKIIEYVATFPNITVDAGQQYKACALPVKNLELICTTGSNSPATRPEFVDLNLNTTTGETEQAVQQEGDEDGSD